MDRIVRIVRPVKKVLPTISPEELSTIQQYRMILRAGLRAVRYASPARYQIHQKIRAAFEELRNLPSGRHNPTSTTDGYQSKLPPHQVKYIPTSSFLNTVEFLNTAAKQKGRESDIVRNLCYVEYDNWLPANKMRMLRMKGNDKVNLDRAQSEYKYMIKMMNHTLDLELR